jgi:hypothetical protein
MRPYPSALLIMALALCQSPDVTPPAPARHTRHAVRVPGTDIMLEAGWELLQTIDGQCMYTVPATWVVSDDRRSARQPDGTTSLSVAALETNWSWHRSAVRSTMLPATVLEDTDHRLWIERRDGQSWWQHVSVGEGGRVCAADIEARPPNRGPEVVQQIASSVRVSHGTARH